MSCPARGAWWHGSICARAGTGELRSRPLAVHSATVTAGLRCIRRTLCESASVITRILPASAANQTGVATPVPSRLKVVRLRYLPLNCGGAGRADCARLALRWDAGMCCWRSWRRPPVYPELAEGDRRLAAGSTGRVRGRVRHGVAGGAAGGLRVHSAPGAPVAVQGDRLSAAEERQGRRGDLGPVAARGSASRSVDRPAAGAGAAGAAAAPGGAGAGADAAAQPDPAP